VHCEPHRLHCFAPSICREKHAAPVRKDSRAHDLQYPGAADDPAGAPNQVMGVFHPDLVGIQVRGCRLGSTRARTRRTDGRVSLAPRRCRRSSRGRLREYEIDPEDFGLRGVQPRTQSQSAESRPILLEAIDNVVGTPREIVISTPGSPLCRECRRLDRRRHCAGAFGDARAARRKLDEFVATTQRLVLESRSRARPLCRVCCGPGTAASCCARGHDAMCSCAAPGPLPRSPSIA